MKTEDIHRDYTLHSVENVSSNLEKTGPHYGPQDYDSLVAVYGTIELSHKNGAYLRIWNSLYAIEMDGAYGISEFLRGAVPIADDGNCRVLFYWHGYRGMGLYICDLDALFEDNVSFIAKSLTELLVIGVGVDGLLLK